MLVRLKLKLNFHDKFSKNTDVLNFTKIHPMGAEVFHADEASSRFPQFCEPG